MIFPKPSEFRKIAGLSGIGEGALLGLLLGAIARRIPYLSSLRATNPAAYDAALGASIVTMQQTISNRQPARPMLLPGQDADPVVLPRPPWSLM